MGLLKALIKYVSAHGALLGRVPPFLKWYFLAFPELWQREAITRSLRGLFPPQYYEVVAVVRELHRLGMVAMAVHTLSGTLSPRK